MTEVFLDLLNMSISASWMILAVLVLRFVMKKAPRWAVCGLWALVAIRLVFPFSIESVFSLIPSTQTLPPDILTENRFQISSGVPVIDHQINDVVLDDYYEGVTVPTDNGFNVMSTLTVLWLVGMAAIILYAVISYLRLRFKVSASMQLRDNLYLCDYIESPFILGIIRPKIYLPSTLEEVQWPHVIAHEKAHLKRRDHWWKPLGYGLLCLHWFNPLMWVAYILLCRDIELACDEKVIKELGETQKKAYSEALLSCSVPRYMIAACPLAFGEVGVKARVKSVLNYRKPAFWVILISLVLCIAVAVCFLTDPAGNSTITPGVYNINTTLYLEPYPNGGSLPVVPQGQYTLHNQILYLDNGYTVTSLGSMTPYELDNWELSGYLRSDGNWQTLSHRIPTITDTLWLRMEDNSFYVLFQVASGETFLGRGWEDDNERHTESDDTRITQLCHLTQQDSALTENLAWFNGTILEVNESSILVEPAAGTAESSRFTQIHVSRYLYVAMTDTFGEIAGTTVIPDLNVGDRVRVVYDGYISEGDDAWIRSTQGIEILSPSTNQYASSGNNQITTLNQAILNGCVAMVNGDVVAGEDIWQDFVAKTRNGESASVRYVEYTTITNPNNYDPADLPEIFSQYPVMYIIDLTFDGEAYTLRRLENGTEYVYTYPYLMHYTGKPDSIYASYDAYDRYVLTESQDVTWEDIEVVLSSRYIPHHPVYTDLKYPNEPTQAELEQAKDALTPYMIEYRIASLDANELTGRLDVEVYEYVDGLYDMISRHMDTQFVTVSKLKGTLVFTGGPTDKPEPDPVWDISIGLSNVSPTGATMVFGPTGGLELGYGSRYWIETLVDGVWQEVPQVDSDAILTWTDEIRLLSQDSPTEVTVDWSMRYGTLEPGIYRMGKTILEPEVVPGTQQTCYAEFEITAEAASTDPSLQCEISIELLDVTATEGVVAYHIRNLGDATVWAGYKYHLEVLTDTGWVHYGYPPEDLAWETAFRFNYDHNNPESAQEIVIHEENWSRVAEAPLSPGTYRFCKSITLEKDGLTTSQTYYAEFTVSEETPENWGLHLEILNPTNTGATLALTYNGGLMSELSTEGKYYLMVDVGDGASTTYGLLPSQVDWDDVRYSLVAGETIYLDVRWDHTADAPLPLGTYYVVLEIGQYIPYGSDSGVHMTQYITESFAVIE